MVRAKIFYLMHFWNIQAFFLVDRMYLIRATYQIQKKKKKKKNSSSVYYAISIIRRQYIEKDKRERCTVYKMEDRHFCQNKAYILITLCLTKFQILKLGHILILLF